MGGIAINRVYKLTPVSSYDIAGLESWLEDMAQRGLYLKKLRPFFCTFTKGEPRSTRYRVEAHRRGMDDDLPQSMLELYEDFGWDCVGEIGRSMLVFATQDPDAPELHTDPEVQLGQWNQLRRSTVWGSWFTLLVLLLGYGLLFYVLFDNGKPIRALIVTNALPLALYLLLGSFTIPSLFADVRQLSRIVQQLKEGIPLDHRTVYPRRRPQAVVSFLAAVTLMAVLVVCQYILPFTGGHIRPIGELTAFEPISLATLEGEHYVPDHFEVDGRDYSNFCNLERYLLCWSQWEVVQTGIRGADGLWVRLEIQWYDLPGPLLATPLAREQLEQALDLDQDIWWTSGDTSGWTVNYFHPEGVDLLAVAHQSNRQFQVAAVAAGDKVAIARYTGHGQLSDHLNSLANMVR